MRLARGEAAVMLSDPAFRRGYDDAWSSLTRLSDVMLDSSERRAYMVGFDFGMWCKENKGERLPLVRAGVANAETVAALIRCSLAGALGVAA